MRLHHVQLACPAGGEDAARRFYGDVLGLREIPKPPDLAVRGGIWFAGDGFEVHIGVEEPFSPTRKAHPCFEVSDVDAYARSVTDAELSLTWDDAVPDVRRFHTVDGNGNRIEISAPVG